MKKAWAYIFAGDLSELKEIVKEVNEIRKDFAKLSLNKYGWTPLHAACYFGKTDIVKYLIEEKGADPNLSNDNGWHSVIFAVMGGTGYEVLKYLLNMS